MFKLSITTIILWIVLILGKWQLCNDSFFEHFIKDNTSKLQCTRLRGLSAITYWNVEFRLFHELCALRSVFVLELNGQYRVLIFFGQSNIHT